MEVPISRARRKRFFTTRSCRICPSTHGTFMSRHSPRFFSRKRTTFWSRTGSSAKAVEAEAAVRTARASKARIVTSAASLPPHLAPSGFGVRAVAPVPGFPVGEGEGPLVHALLSAAGRWTGWSGR